MPRYSSIVGGGCGAEGMLQGELQPHFCSVLEKRVLIYGSELCLSILNA